MLRIIAGELKGRKIPVPPEHVRPTSNKVREAVFDILGSRISIAGKKFLDCFAGSGAVGFEAISRGAVFTEFVEENGKAFNYLKSTIELLKLDERAIATRGRAPRQSNFDIAFADPPYKDENDFTHIASRIIPSGFIILENANSEPPAIPDVNLLRSYSYGKTKLHLFQKKVSDE